MTATDGSTCVTDQQFEFGSSDERPRPAVHRGFHHGRGEHADGQPGQGVDQIAIEDGLCER